MKLDAPKNNNYAATVVRIHTIVELVGLDNLVGVPVLGYQALTTRGIEAGELVLVFTAETQLGMLMQHAQKPPTPPSIRTELPIPKALEELVLSCLAKDPAHRPQSARELSLRLAELEGASAWTQDRAREWWATYQPAPQRMDGGRQMAEA